MAKRFLVCFAAGLAALGAFSSCSRQSDAAKSAGAGGGGGRGGGRGGPGGPIPVVAGTVQQRDTPVYLDGIGTVAAFNTVTVRPQIDGMLQSINFIEGQDVNRGDLLAVIDPRTPQAQFNQATAKKAEDSAQLANAQLNLERNNALLAKGLIDQQTFDTQKAAADQLRAQVEADAAALEGAQVLLDYTRITAPIPGRTGLRQIDVGNIIHPSDPNGIVVISQLKPISVIFTLPQQNLPQIQKLVSAGEKLAVMAFDRDNRTMLDQGTLTVVDNQVETATGTIKIKATFPNEHLSLWPGQFVNVRLLAETRKNGVVVPANVVQRGPQGTYAFVIKPDTSVEVRTVQVAQIDGGWALIDQGLQPGEQVVVDGQYKLQAGSKVVVSTEGGSRGGGTAPARGGGRRGRPPQ